jgi:NTP pyrophosphatase (non-canonical NTP hydrolase)
MTAKDDVQLLVERLLRFRDNRDWAKFHTPRNLAASVSIEAAELLEIFQWISEEDGINADMLAKTADEAADVYIYLLLLCERLGIDLIASANRKVDCNEERFPAISAEDKAEK